MQLQKLWYQFLSITLLCITYAVRIIEDRHFLELTINRHWAIRLWSSTFKTTLLQEASRMKSMSTNHYLSKIHYNVLFSHLHTRISRWFSAESEHAVLTPLPLSPTWRVVGPLYLQFLTRGKARLHTFVLIGQKSKPTYGKGHFLHKPALRNIQQGCLAVSSDESHCRINTVFLIVCSCPTERRLKQIFPIRSS